MTPQFWEVVKAIGTWLIPLAIALSTILLNRKLKNADDSRNAQTLLIAEVKGSVNTHGTDIAVLKNRVDGHDREIRDIRRGSDTGSFYRRRAGDEDANG